MTFEKWALLAALYFRPWPCTPTGLQRVAKAVSLLRFQREPHFAQYQSYHETKLESLLLPNADELASKSNFKLVFLMSPDTANTLDNTDNLPRGTRSAVAAGEQRAAVRAGLAAEAEERKKHAETARQGQTRRKTTIQRLQDSVGSNANMAKQEKAARERHRTEVDAAIREIWDNGETSNDAAPLPAALAEDVCKIVDGHLPGALRHVLRLHARAKEETASKR